MGQVIADIVRNNREIIRVEVSEFKGRELINLRIWYQHFDGDYKPTQKGIALDIEHYDELQNAINKIGMYLKDKKSGSIPNINQPIEDEVIDEDEPEEKEEE